MKKLVKLLLVLIPLLTICGILSTQRFLGLSPNYPNAQRTELCESPELFTIGNSDYWHLRSTVCFETTDSPEQIFAWYESIGWTGNPVEKDRFGRAITTQINVGSRFNAYTTKDIWIVNGGFYVNTQHQWFILPCIPLPTDAQKWQGGEMFSVIPTFIKICLSALLSKFVSKYYVEYT